MMLRVSSLQKATPMRYAIRGNLGKRSIEAVILYSAAFATGASIAVILIFIDCMNRTKEAR